MMTMDIEILRKIPNEIRRLKQWAVYDNQGNKSASTGMLFDAEFSTTDLESFEYCFSQVKQQKYDGVCFYVTPKNLITIIEMKYTDDYDTSLKYSEIIKKIGSYSEVNPDASNIIICKATINHNFTKKNISISNKTFIRLSGNQCSMNSDIIESQGYVSQIFSELVGATFDKLESETKIELSNMEAPESQTDEEILETLQREDIEDKFQKLWTADIFKKYASKKEAAIELIKLITNASRSKNKAQIERIYSYSQLSIELGENIAPIVEKFTNKPKIHEEEPIIIEEKQETAEFFKNPPGRMNELIDFIYSSSDRQCQPVAMLSALMLISGMVGRTFTINRSALNLYFMLVAGTGIGKEQAEKSRQYIFDEIAYKTGNKGIHWFSGPAAMGSGEGLTRYLSNHSLCFASIMSEFADVTSRCSKKLQTSADESLKKMLLILFDKGYTTVKPTVYSDEKKNTNPLVRPCMTLLGECNPKDFYATLNEKMVSSGLLPRFIILEYTGKREYHNKNAGSVKIPENLLKFLCQLSKFCMDMNQSNETIEIFMEKDAIDRMEEIDKETTDIMNENEEGIKQLYNRIHLKCFRLSAILSIMEAVQDANGDFDFTNCCVTKEQVNWCYDFTMAATRKLEDKFRKGEIGTDSQNDEKIAFTEIKNCMKEYEKLTPEKIKDYSIDAELQSKKMVSYRFLLQRLSQKGIFRNHRLGGTQHIKNTLKNLIEHEEIEQVTISELKKLGNFRGHFYRLKKQ